MVVTTIYVTRHGFRGNWTVDPHTGKYYTTVPSPTNIPSDPPLAAYGVRQAEQLAAALVAIRDPPITHIYSSPYYRCLQTVQPFVEKSGLVVKGDTGVGEWYGLARFLHPSPASPSLLRTLFPSYNSEYKPSIIPSTSGENISTLHDRCAYALNYIVTDADIEDANSSGKHARETSILVCTHAASMIAIGRVLTGNMPSDAYVEDFKTYTCGISKFKRRDILCDKGQDNFKNREAGMHVQKLDWQAGKGVAGGWDCVMNCNCDHLDGGEERGWRFHGDEAFDVLDAPLLCEHRAKNIDPTERQELATSKI